MMGCSLAEAMLKDQVFGGQLDVGFEEEGGGQDVPRFLAYG